MKDRGLIILALAAVVLLVVTVVLYSVGNQQQGKFVAGAALIQGLAPETVHKVVVNSASGTVTLPRKEADFVVSEKSGYPASVKKINDLIIKCLEIRCAEEITDSEQHHAELGVAEGEGDAVSVSFLDAEGQPIVGFVRGKSAERSSGRYVRLLDKDTVYRTENYLYLSTRPIDYIDRTLVSVEQKDVKRVCVEVGEDAYTISRDEKEQITLENVPEGKRAKTSPCEEVFGALSGLNMTDVSQADKLELAWDATYTSHLKSGLSYTVQLAEKDGTNYVRLAAKGPEKDRIQISKTESDEELKKKEAIILAMKTTREFTARHTGWVYEVSTYQAEPMRKPIAELIEDIPKEAAPQQISARHILISYKGAERSKAERSKLDAKALAQQVLKQARKKDADFAALARKYSDSPTKDKGGDLGQFKKGEMAPAFEKAAFDLDVGEVSDLVETPFGFHIIKRTK